MEIYQALSPSTTSRCQQQRDTSNTTLITSSSRPEYDEQRPKEPSSKFSQVPEPDLQGTVPVPKRYMRSRKQSSVRNYLHNNGVHSLEHASAYLPVNIFSFFLAALIASMEDRICIYSL